MLNKCKFEHDYNYDDYFTSIPKVAQSFRALYIIHTYPKEANIPYLIKKNVSTEKVALLIVWNIKFLSVTVRKILFSARCTHAAEKRKAASLTSYQ